MLNRAIIVTTPLGPEVLVFDRMRGKERLGQTFRYEVDVLSKVASVPLDKLLGERVTVHVDLPAPLPWRYFNGVVTSAAYLGPAGDQFRFRLILEPWLSLLSLTSRSRIFQHESVPTVVKEIFREHGFSDIRESITQRKPWEYLVQYRESDLNFVCRMLEQEGIYFFFEHDKDKHVLVLADAPSAHKPATGYETIPYYPPQEGARREREHFLEWVHAQELCPGSFSSRDFDFQDARNRLDVRRSGPRLSSKAGTHEVYDAPGEYRTHEEGDQLALIRLQELQAEHATSEASGNTRGIGVGNTFKLTNFPDKNQNDHEYLVVGASYELTGTQFASGQHNAEQDYRCRFDVISSATPFRTPRTTPRPIVQGPQTAIVVGEAGEDIWTDKYGRVKVKFHWDRDGKADESSSCWVRVSQAWAGNGWGAIHIPRVGQEVIVDFLEGDPDRPIITGRVYNNLNMPPYDLPANRTQSGIKSRSSKDGGVDNFNELRFEDRKGSEEVYLQAERNLTSLIKNDEQRTIGRDRVTDIKNDEQTTIAGNRSTFITKDDQTSVEGNHALIIQKDEKVEVNGKRVESVKLTEEVTITGARTTTCKNNDTLFVNGELKHEVDKPASLTFKSGRITRVTKDNDALQVKGTLSQEANEGISTKTPKKIVLDGGAEVEIKSGKASITLKEDGTVLIKGINIKVEGSANVDVKGSAGVLIKGATVSQN